MLLKYGALVCYDCGEVHQSLQTSTIKSVFFDAWTLNETLVSENVKRKFFCKL